MLTSIFALFLLVSPQTLALSNAGKKQIIDNVRTTVWESTGQAAEKADHDRVTIDLARPGNAVFIKKGETQPNTLSSIVVDLKDVNIPPIPNKTPYPLAFPREGVRKILENNRVIVWDYSWTPGKPTVMHFHDKQVVVVYMANGKLKSTTPDGQSVVNTISFGLTKFNEPDRSHSEEVVDGTARAVMVEFK
jgi:hypothetical protein